MYQRGDIVYLGEGARRRAFLLSLTFFYHGEKYGVLFPRRSLLGKSAVLARADAPYTSQEQYLPLPLEEQRLLLEFLQR
ncbi:MAG: hypothetical protein PHO66_05435 [Eubacteriales bacterium]|nr:hypothetical protein [Eubacteriales bacterium]